MVTKRYTARCEHEDGWWIVTVPELPGVFTHSRRLSQISELVTEAIELWLNKPQLEVEVRLEIVGIKDAMGRWEKAQRARERAETLSASASKLSREAVRMLTDQGISRRDAAEILKLSPQRIQQLVRPSDQPVMAPAKRSSVAATKQSAKRPAAKRAARKAG